VIHGVSETLPESADTRRITLVAALKAGRHALGWSQSQLASASGVSRVTIARMEAGMLTPRPATFDALLKAMEGAGVVVTLGEPVDGFSMAVEGRALRQAETDPSPVTSAALKALGEMTVDLRTVGLPQVDKRGARKADNPTEDDSSAT
jgi:transcriptional regulator with XRE-family HTH domain